MATARKRLGFSDLAKRPPDAFRGLASGRNELLLRGVLILYKILYFSSIKYTVCIIPPELRLVQPAQDEGLLPPPGTFDPVV